MQLTWLSLLGAFIMLVIGVVEYGLLRRLLYTRLRRRHEAAKVTQSQGLDPNVFWAVLKYVSLLAMPVLGLILGEAVLGPLLR